MNSDLEKKVLKEIRKSGFPLELEVIDALRKNNFIVSPNLYFTNSNNELSEVDALAILSSKKSNKWSFGTISCVIIVECKKSSEKPWVFFEEITDPTTLLGLLPKLKCLTHLIFLRIEDVLTCSALSEMKDHHYNANISQARTYFEAFKNYDSKSEIFKAIINLWQAAYFLNSWFNNISLEATKKKKLLKQTLFYHSLIVLDGQLLLARRNGKEFILEEKEHILLRTIDSITCKTKAPFPLENEVIIDVIQKDYLLDYIKICKKDLKLFQKHVISLMKNGWISEH